MENIHLQFNSDLIQKIRNFLENSDDVLLFNAPSGTGKNAILNIALKDFEEDFLKFYYYCNSLTVIEDFLLGFYDTLRDYTIQKKIILKKDLSDDFTQKVSNYMKALTQKALIIIDNYDKIKDIESINNFLSDVSKQKRTKLILLSRTKVSLDRFKEDGLKVVEIEKEEEEEDVVIQKISASCPTEELGSIRDLYKISKSNTTLLQITFNYINTTNTSLYKLVDEYYKKPQSFDNFITGKTLSLIPQNYMDSIKILSMTNFITTTSYLEKYALFDISFVPYLKQHLIVNQVGNNIYEFENVRNYFAQNLSIADKIQFGEIIINSLNQELSKGPKDRILRLSREGLRKQIENLQNNIPRVNPNVPTNAEVSYYSQVQNTSVPWLLQNPTQNAPKHDDEVKSPIQEDLEMLKQFRQATFEHKAQKYEESEEEKKQELQNKIKEAENNFDFQNVILYLQELLKIDEKNENTILEKIAENYSKLNKNDEAQNYYIKVSDNYKNQGDKAKYFKTLLKIGNIELKTYNLESANKVYDRIIKEDDNVPDIIEAYCAKGNIKEKKSEENDALKCYEEALKISLDNNLNEKSSEIYYFISTIYEKQNEVQRAKENLEKSIQIGKDNAVLGDSHLSLASLLFDEGDVKSAVSHFETAISKFQNEKTPKVSSLYSANSNLAYIYKAINLEDKEEIYLKEALKWARTMNDRFEITNTCVALGDCYYNKSMNKEALYNYLNALDTLNEDESSKNYQMIASRIEDMKYKLGNDFETIIEEYEQTRS